MDSRLHDDLTELLQRTKRLQELLEAPSSPRQAAAPAASAQLRAALAENEQLQQHIKLQDDLIASKNDVIALLRGKLYAPPASPGN